MWDEILIRPSINNKYKVNVSRLIREIEFTVFLI